MKAVTLWLGPFTLQLLFAVAILVPLFPWGDLP